MDKVSVPIRSATILLLRDSTDGIEVFMVTRNAGIDFAGGALVFPGGKFHPTDLDDDVVSYCDGIDGLKIDEIGNRVCGIRETFEEAGFLLARNTSDRELVDRERCSMIGAKYRQAVLSEEMTMKDIAHEEQFTLACDQMVPFAHWITPQSSPKRFDTWFFLAKVPEGQVGSHDNLETVDSLWINPSKALAAAADQTYKIPFATRMNLAKLGYSDDVRQALALAKANQIITVEPEVIRGKESTTFRIPLEAGYGIEQETETNNIPIVSKEQA